MQGMDAGNVNEEFILCKAGNGRGVQVSWFIKF